MPPFGLRSRNFAIGRIRTRRLHQLDLAAGKLDVGEPHALLLVDHPLADRKPESLGKHPRRGLDVRHHDRHMADRLVPIIVRPFSVRDAAAVPTSDMP